MIAIDTDVMTSVLYGNASIVARLNAVPITDQLVPIVVVDEILRGRLATVRQAEGGTGSLTDAYDKLERSIRDLRALHILPFTSPAETLVADWKRQKLRVGMKDLRIAAICIVHGAKLVTRNARDFNLVPGLNLEIWN